MLKIVESEVLVLVNGDGPGDVVGNALLVWNARVKQDIVILYSMFRRNRLFITSSQKS